MQKVNTLKLTYSIRFNDADDGDCYAGEGCRILSVHSNPLTANAIIVKFGPVFCYAENEHTVFPVQKFNGMLKKQFGFTVHDIDNGYDFKLSIDTFDIE